MTDPAVAAARRAWEANPELPAPYIPGDRGLWTPEAMEAAANEALKPIRALADKWHAATNLSDGQPNTVAWAFADELYRALGDRR